MGMADFDFTPSIHLAASMKNQNLPWWKALAELIDNSFDAKADRVDIRCAKRCVTVIDNGRGMKDVASCLKPGNHVPANGRGLGMYGIGLKDAWLSSGEKIDLISIRDGVRSFLTVDFGALREVDGRWTVACNSSFEPTAEESGTTITLHLRQGRNLPDNHAWDRLAWVFSPGIESGLQIRRHSGTGWVRLAARPMPLFSDDAVVTDSFTVNGKAVSIHIGLLRQGERAVDGPFSFAYRHRIIETSTLGAKGMSCLNVSGRVTLGDGWVFSKNKDAIAENCDELEDAIHSRIRHILVKAEQQAMDIQSSALRQSIEHLVNTGLESSKREARTSRKEATGTVEPRHTGAKRTKASKIHEHLPGSVAHSAAARKRGITIDWFHGAETIGRYEPRSNTVLLNVDHPFVANTKSDSNDHALAAIAMAVLADFCVTNTENGQKLLIRVDDFGSTFGNLMPDARTAQ